MRMSLTTDELPRLASPSSFAELSELMARAHAENRTVAVFGGGTAFDDHPPASTPGLLIDLTSIAEVADHADDTIRAGAGTRISALNRFAAQSGQEILADLPLDRVEAGATLGGMISTAATGPRCLRRPRLAETVQSVTTVAADGTIARTAYGLHPDLDGRDLPGLVIGSWGTRAIIVEAEIRLAERAETQRFVWIPGPEAAADLLVARRVPDAVVIERPPGSPAATVVLIEGDTDEVEAEVGSRPKWATSWIGSPGQPRAGSRNGGGAELAWPRPSGCPWHRVSFRPSSMPSTGWKRRSAIRCSCAAARQGPSNWASASRIPNPEWPRAWSSNICAASDCTSSPPGSSVRPLRSGVRSTRGARSRDGRVGARSRLWSIREESWLRAAGSPESSVGRPARAAGSCDQLV